MYKKVSCTRKVVVLLIKPIVFMTFSFSSASLDLEPLMMMMVVVMIVVSLSKEVFERRMSTGSGLFFIFGQWFCTKLWKNRLYNSKDRLRNTNSLASRSFKMKKTALAIGVRCSKRLCLSFLIGTGLSKDVSERSRSTGGEFFFILWAVVLPKFSGKSSLQEEQRHFIAVQI